MRTKSDSRRQAIIDVAAQVFLEHGFERASMSEIAVRVGGSKATLYSYFSSKEELFAETVGQYADQHMETIFPLLEKTDSLRDGLQEFGEQFLNVRFSSEALTIFRTVVAEAGKGEIGRMFYDLGPKKGIGLMSAFLERRMASGDLRTTNPAVAAMHLVSLLEAETFHPALFGVDAYDEADRKNAVARAVDVFLRAYAMS